MKVKNILIAFIFCYSSIFIPAQAGETLVAEEISSFDDMDLADDSSSMIPNNLPWPLDSKNIRHTSFFFNTDDAVEVIGRTCRNGRFPKHLGVDIHAASGTPVKAVYPGHVVRKGSSTGWGDFVVLSHDNNTWTSVYWHLEDITVRSDDRHGNHYNGEDVSAGEVLGYVFDTSGMGDVSHLHFGIHEGEYIPNEKTNGVKGIGNCEGSKDPLLNFKNPYKHLSNSGYSLIDDTQAEHKGNWIPSRGADFYTGEGYKVLEKNKTGSAIYSHTTKTKGVYYIYTRFSPYSDRTQNAVYKIYINGALKKTISINQKDMNFRGHNVPLAGYNVHQSNVDFKIEVSNGDDSAVLISDAILFRKR